MQTNSLPKRLAQGGSATYGKWIYFVGGFTDYQNNASSDVYFSEVNIDGSLGTWASTTSLPQPGYGMDLIENNGYLYVIGLNDSQVVLYSKINDDFRTWLSPFHNARIREGICCYTEINRVVAVYRVL
jgi:N-acetylneuraminic acid mutarotase